MKTITELTNEFKIIAQQLEELERQKDLIKLQILQVVDGKEGVINGIKIEKVSGSTRIDWQNVALHYRITESMLGPFKKPTASYTKVYMVKELNIDGAI